MRGWLLVVLFASAAISARAGKTPVSLPARPAGGREAQLEALLEARRSPLPGKSMREMKQRLLDIESQLATLIETSPADPVRVTAAGHLARSLSDRGELDAAIAVCEKMRAGLSTPRDVFDGCRLQSEIYVSCNMPEKAVELLEKYLATKPPEELRDRAEAGLIHFLAAAGRYDQAADWTMRQLLPDAPLTHKLGLEITAAGYRARGANPARAKADALKLLETARRHGAESEIYRVIGAADAALGKHEAASAWMRKALDGQQGQQRVAIALAECDMWVKAGRLDRAISSLEAGFMPAADASPNIPLQTRRDGLALVGKPPPEFTAPSVDGDPIALSSLEGKVVLLFFGASYAADVAAEVPFLRDIAKEHAGKPFEILGVSVDAERDLPAVKSQLVRLGATWRTAISSEEKGGPVAMLYGVRSVPQTILVGLDGKVIAAGQRGTDLVVAVRRAVQGK